MSHNIHENLIDVKTSSYLSGLSYSTIIRMIRRGDLPAKFTNGKYRVYPSDLRTVVIKYRMQADIELKKGRGKSDIPVNLILKYDDYISNIELDGKYRDRHNITKSAVTC